MQLNYDTSLSSSPFLLGQVFDTSLNQIDSLVSTSAVSFGQPVMLSVDGLSISAPLNTATGYAGIAVRTNYQPAGGVLNAANVSPYITVLNDLVDQYPAGSMVSVMKMGRIAIKNPNFTLVASGANGVSPNATGTSVGLPVWYKHKVGTLPGVNSLANGAASAVGDIVAAEKNPSGGNADPANNDLYVQIGVALTVPAPTITPGTFMVIQVTNVLANKLI